MFARNLAYCIQHRAPFIGDVQGITPAVVAILPPFDQSSCLHVIHECNQSAWHHSENGSEALLGHTRP